MEKKTVIVTGANAGIGREAARQLMGKGFHVVLACRNEAAGTEALKAMLGASSKHSGELMLVDMGTMSSVRSFAAEAAKKFKSIDVLIHNAAIFNITQKERALTPEGRETVWATNHLGPVLLTELLADQLTAARGRVITISSKGLVAMPFLKVSLEDPEFEDRKFSIVKAYYQSKIAQMMFTQWLARRFSDSGVSANCIRVPAVQIDISRHPELSNFMKWVYAQKSKQSISPARMAETYTWLAASEEAGDLNGAYVDEHQRKLHFGAYAGDPENIQAVMKLTEGFVSELSGKV